MEEKTEMKTFKIDYKCPKCNKGYLRHNGMVLTSNPPKYPHSCNNKECDYKETFRFSYPRIVHQEVKVE